jgi:putative oxidoreductase
MHALASLIARILMSAIFVTAGISKVSGYAQTQSYMDSHGVPGALLPLVIALEVIGGLAVLFGVFSRYAGLALAAFCLASAAFFHNNLPIRLR